MVIPCFNEQEVLPVFEKELNIVRDQMSEFEFEIIYVDDGSTDETLSWIRQAAMTDEEVKYISLSRNFGKEAAMFAGLKNSTGDYVAIMDADLQDPPGILPEMVKIIENDGYDCVATRRISREGEPKIRSLFARMFYIIINMISDADIVDGARDYRLMKRDMVDAIIEISERNRFSKGIFGWIGYKTYWYEYRNVKRAVGKTKWSFWKLMKYSVEGIVDFSSVPLTISSWLGIICTVVSLISIVIVIARKLIMGDPVQGWASIICVILFLGGLQLFCIGIIGQYLGRTYSETKKRPHYIAKETNDDSFDKIG